MKTNIFGSRKNINICLCTLSCVFVWDLSTCNNLLYLDEYKWHIYIYIYNDINENIELKEQSLCLFVSSHKKFIKTSKRINKRISDLS